MDKAMEKINEEMQKNPNDLYTEVIGHYITDRCMDVDAAEKIAADRAAEELMALREQLEELQTVPRAVEKVVDEEAISAAVTAAKVAQEQADAVAAKEKETLAEQVETLQKKLAVAASSEVTVFKLHFEQGQTTLAKMRECLGRIADSGDGETAGKLKNAMVAMLTAALDGLK